MVINGLTYDSVNKRLTLAYVTSDITKGGTALNPYVVQDIYDTCIAKGWDVMSNFESLYIFNGVSLYVEGNAHFDISNTSMYFVGEIAGVYFLNANCYLTGENYLIDSNQNKQCKLTGKNTEIKNGSINFGYLLYAAAIKIHNTKVRGAGIFGDTGAIFSSCTMTSSLGYAMRQSGIITVGCVFIDCDVNVKVQFSSDTYNHILEGVSIEGEGKHLRYVTRNYEQQELQILNCNIDPESYVIDPTSLYPAYVPFITTFRWKFDADVKVYDKDENLIIDKTVAMDDEDEVIFCEHHFTVDPEPALEVRYKQPFKVIVSKKGFETIAILDNEVVLGQKTVIRAELKKAIEALVTNKGLAIKANKENYGENRDFAIIP